MSRVLVCGWELPEYAGDTPIEAANYRTWQLVQGLLAVTALGGGGLCAHGLLAGWNWTRWVVIVLAAMTRELGTGNWELGTARE